MYNRIVVTGDQIGKRLISPARRVGVVVRFIKENFRMYFEVRGARNVSVKVRVGALLLGVLPGTRNESPDSDAVRHDHQRQKNLFHLFANPYSICARLW